MKNEDVRYEVRKKFVSPIEALYSALVRLEMISGGKDEKSEFFFADYPFADDLAQMKKLALKWRIGAETRLMESEKEKEETPA